MTDITSTTTITTSGFFGFDRQTLILIAGGIAILIVLIVCIRVRKR